MRTGKLMNFIFLCCILHTSNAQIIYGMYWFNDWQKQQIVEIHNELRASEPAANMQELVWDDRLAALAYNHARRCDAWHRSAYERQGHGYNYIGENIWWSNEGFLRSDLRSVLMDFYNEKAWYDFSTTGCNGPQCGHYTQLVWASTCAVGCAAVHCDGILNGRGINGGHIIVCNYGEGGNRYGEVPFLFGPRCSRCPYGSGCTTTGLCASTCSGQRYSNFQPSRIQNSVQLQSLGRVQRAQPVRLVATREIRPAPTKKYYIMRSRPVNSVCKDYNMSCNYWANNGGCSNRTEHMSQYCPKACQLC